MINITLVCVGNLKDKFFVDAEREYLKRLSAFAKVNVVELKEQNKFENIELIKENEGKLILKQLSLIGGVPILCDREGAQCSSENFAKMIGDLCMKTSQIVFVVGGSYGVSEDVKAFCKNKVSFSKLTFPHGLFRVMLLEQTYRAMTILAGKAYHK